MDGEDEIKGGAMLDDEEPQDGELDELDSDELDVDPELLDGEIEE